MLGCAISFKISNLFDHNPPASQTDGRTDRQTDKPVGDVVRSLTCGRIRAGPSFQLGTLSTYSKHPLYDASKGNDVWFSQRAGFLQQQKNSALGKPDVDLFIARTNRHVTDTTNHQPTSQPK